MPEEIDVVIADGHSMVREGLCSLLAAEDGIRVVDAVDTGAGAIEAARELDPHVLVLDLSIPSPDGVEVTRRLGTLAPDVKILLITCADGDGFVLPALREGAAGIVRKTAPEAELAHAVRVLASGGVYIPPHETALLADAYRKKGTSTETSVPQLLSPRERQVLALTVRGFTAREIARELELSPKTVEGYLANVREKLDAHHRSELVDFALHTGLVADPGS